MSLAARRRTRAALLALVVGLGTLAFGPAAPAGAAEPSVIIHGGGCGHGIGMGQYGAEGMGRQGKSAAQILQHYYTGTSVGSGGPWNNVRVLLDQASVTYEIRPAGTVSLVPPSGAPRAVSAGEVISIGGNGSKSWVKVDGDDVDGSPFDAPAQPFVSLNGTRATLHHAGGGMVGEYARGNLEISTGVTGCGANQCAVARDMTMDQYLYGLSEVPSSWTNAALQAQAITGRSYAARRMAQPRVPGLYDILDTTQDQHYTGYAKEGGPSGNRWVAAVNATSNKVLKAGSAIAQTFYSSSTGGRTETNEYVWKSAPISYLRSVPDPTDSISINPNHSWSRTYTLKQIGSWFGVKNVRDIRISGKTGVSGRVDQADVKIIGSTTKTVSGNTFRTTINANVPFSQEIMSTKYQIVDITGFSDVPPNSYYATGVNWLSGYGITTGVGDTGLYMPHRAVNRAEMVTFLWRMMGSPKVTKAHGFPDVPGNSYYEPAVRWAKATGVTGGFADTNYFRPARVVTRDQMAVFLHRVSGLKKPTKQHGFPDVRRGSWYDAAVSWASQYGVTTGVGDTGLYKPLDPVTRGQMAAFLYRTASKDSAWADPLPPTAP